MSSATQDSPAVVSRPRRRRSVVTWIAIGVVLLVVGAAGATISALATQTQRGVLDPESAAPSGARALVEILRDHGVDVVVAHDRADAAAALARGPATLVLPDPFALTDGAVTTLTDAATDVVLIEPRARSLRLMLPGSSLGGYASDDLVDPACPLPEAQRAGAVAVGALYEPGDATTACYTTDGGAGLLVQDDGARRISAVDARPLFTNERLASDGNSALAVNLMGRHPLLVWYVPSLDDTDLPDADPSLGELTPPWVSPAVVLLITAAIAAGIWRGRRFGPLVTERLPVTVRAGETTAGRARLYARSRDAAHAADQLRLASLDRVARLLGLGPAASAVDIADAVAALLDWDRAPVRSLLVDDVPADDRGLVELDARLRHLERAVQAAVRPDTHPEGSTP